MENIDDIDDRDNRVSGGMSFSFFMKNFDLIAKATDDKSTKCITCKAVLNPDITGMHKIKDGYECDDCYYDHFGEEIDKHPIHNPLHKIKNKN